MILLDLVCFKSLGSKFQRRLTLAVGCKNAVEISDKVGEFICYMDGVGEESLTDFLLWQIKKYSYLPTYSVNLVEKFSKKEEGKTTGADFSIRVYFIDRQRDEYLSLAIQAKKAIKESDGYCEKLKYKSGKKSENESGVESKYQIKQLIEYSGENGCIPLYLFYTNFYIPERIPSCSILNLLHCLMSYISVYPTSLVLADAKYLLKSFLRQGKCGNFGNNTGYNLTKGELLKDGFSFSCLFCCPIATGNNPTPLEHLLAFLYLVLPSWNFSGKDFREWKKQKDFSFSSEEAIYDFIFSMIREKKKKYIKRNIPIFIRKYIKEPLEGNNLKKFRDLLEESNLIEKGVPKFRNILVFDITRK